MFSNFPNTLKALRLLQVSTTCIMDGLHIIFSELKQKRLKRGFDFAGLGERKAKLIQREVLSHLFVL